MKFEDNDIEVKTVVSGDATNCTLVARTENGVDCLNHLMLCSTFDESIESWLSDVANESVDAMDENTTSVEEDFGDRMNDILTKAMVSYLNKKLELINTPH